MREPNTTGGIPVATTHVQTTLDILYTVKLRRRRRLKRGYQRNGEKDGRRLEVNNGTQSRSTRGRQVRRTRELRLANMYQYNTTGGVHADMPPPIDEHTIIIHVGGTQTELNLILTMKG
jgi:hypothetical protein